MRDVSPPCDGRGQHSLIRGLAACTRSDFAKMVSVMHGSRHGSVGWAQVCLTIARCAARGLPVVGAVGSTTLQRGASSKRVVIRRLRCGLPADRSAPGTAQRLRVGATKATELTPKSLQVTPFGAPV